MAIGEAIARKGIQKRYWLETRADVLLRNKEVFQLWARLGLKTMFIGLEAIDEEGLKKFRKRVQLLEELRGARVRAHASASTSRSTSSPTRLGPRALPRRPRVVREIPEVVNISVNTPYPGTETWLTESRRLTTRDYRLFDIQHAVLPTTLPLPEFYEELVATQQVLNRKHLGARQIWGAAQERRPAARARADELPAHAVQVQQRLRPEAPARRPRRSRSRYEMSLPPAPRDAVDPETRSTSTRRAAAAAARSTTRPSASSTRRAWARPSNGAARRQGAAPQRGAPSRRHPATSARAAAAIPAASSPCRRRSSR